MQVPDVHMRPEIANSSSATCVIICLLFLIVHLISLIGLSETCSWFHLNSGKSARNLLVDLSRNFT